MATDLVTIPIFIGYDADAEAIGSVNAGSTRTFDAVTAHIDQMGVAAGSGGGVIRKAHLEVQAQTTSGTAVTAWEFTLAIDGGSASPAYSKTGQTIGGPGTYYVPRVDGDFTSWLASNWPSATASCSIVATVKFTGTTTNPPTINATAILWVTVEYDPAACATLTKWVPLLVGSFDGQMGTSFVTIASTPQLTGLSTGTFRIPESGATLRQNVLELNGNSGGLMSSSTQGTPIVRVGGAGGTSYTHTSETHSGAGNSRLERFLISGPSPAAASTVEMRCTSVNGSYPYLYSGITTIWHLVYSYTQSGTTEVLVGAYHYVGKGQGLPGYGTETDAMQLRTVVQVPEASVAAQGPMGWEVMIGDSDHFKFNLRGYQLAGPLDSATVLQTKTAQAYECVRHSDSGDQVVWAHRVDGGAGAGGAHVLAAGSNYFKLNAWGSDISAIVGAETYRRGIQPSARFFYAYNAPVAAAGPWASAHVIECSILPMSYFSTPSGAARFNASSLATSTERAAPPIPSGSYIEGAGVRMHLVQNTTAISAQLSGRQSGKPVVALHEGHVYGGFAVCWGHPTIDLTEFFLQYPAQPPRPSGGWAPATALDLFMCCGNSGRFAITQMVCFHQVTRTVTIAVTGYTGDGSGLAVAVFRADTGERVADVTTAAGGGASFVYPISAESLYASTTQGGNAAVSLATTGNTITVPFPTPTTRAEGALYHGGYTP